MDHEFIKQRLASSDLKHYSSEEWKNLISRLILDSESIHANIDSIKYCVKVVKEKTSLIQIHCKALRKNYGRTNKKDDVKNGSLRRFVVALEESSELSEAIADCLNDLCTTGKITQEHRLAYLEEQADVITITKVLNQLMDISEDEISMMRDVKAERISNSITDGDTFF